MGTKPHFEMNPGLRDRPFAAEHYCQVGQFKSLYHLIVPILTPGNDCKVMDIQHILKSLEGLLYDLRQPLLILAIAQKDLPFGQYDTARGNSLIHIYAPPSPKTSDQ